MLEDNFEWNQADFDINDPINRGFIIILAFTPAGEPQPIGTAFIISDGEKYFTAATAAHNFSEVHSLQNPVKLYHRTALPEFLPNPKLLSLDSEKVKALCFTESGPFLLDIYQAFYDTRSDIALFDINKKDLPPNSLFKNFHLDERIPEVGDNLVMFGYANLNANYKQSKEKIEEFSLECKLIMRRGKIANIYMNGHYLCKDSCVETNIPVFSGMSGGPVAFFDEEGSAIKIFGVVCSDPTTCMDDKLNRSISGAAIAALIKPVRMANDNANLQIQMNAEHTKIVKKDV